MMYNGNDMFVQKTQKPIRLTDTMCIEMFRQQFGANIKVVHMREYQAGVIHACKNSGVLKLLYQTVTIANRAVHYAYCACCATVWYYVPEIL